MEQYSYELTLRAILNSLYIILYGFREVHETIGECRILACDVILTCDNNQSSSYKLLDWWRVKSTFPDSNPTSTNYIHISHYKWTENQVS